jgi:hypothetical protein
MASQPRPDIPALLLRFHHHLVSIGSVFTGKCGSREGLPVLSRRRWKPATRPAGHPCPRRASRPSGRRPHLRAAVLCAAGGVDRQPAGLRNPGRGRGCSCYLDGVGNRSAGRMPEASVRRDGTGNPDQRLGQRQLAGGLTRRRGGVGRARRARRVRRPSGRSGPGRRPERGSSRRDPACGEAPRRSAPRSCRPRGIASR